MNRLDCSLVIPAYKGLADLPDCLRAASALPLREIIVADDASPDGTADWVHQHYPQVKLIRHSHNLRFPANANSAVSAAAAPIVILINQDVIVTPDLITNLTPYFSDPQVFGVSLTEKNASWAQAWIKHGFLEFNHGQMDGKPHTPLWISGGSCAFRAEAFRKLGGFDQIFSPGYSEDLDIGWRAWRRGYRLIWAPDLPVDHHHETVFSKSFSSSYLRRLKDRNYLLVHWKNLELKTLPLHFGFLLLRIFRSPGYIIPVIQALIHLPQIINYRYHSPPAVLAQSQIFAAIR